MSDTPAYTPPKVWTWNKESGGRFANINRPIAGPTHDKDLPVGKHPFQLYSLATPNGVKVTIILEELLAAGIDARGPFPADSVFWHAAEGRFDAVLSLYHDQGHVAAKM